MIEVNQNNFDEIVLQAKTPVVLDLWAPWCSPCMMITPILEELSNENKHITFVKCNVDQNPQIANKYSIRNIPTVMFFNKGKLLDTQVGVNSKMTFNSAINKLYS